MSGVNHIPWSGSHPPTEEDLRSILERECLTPMSWSNGPQERYQAHRHAYDKVLYVVSGSIDFILPSEDKELHLKPGDRLELPAGTMHAAHVGEEGVLCLEAHRI